VTFMIKKYGDGSDALEAYDAGDDFAQALDKFYAEILDIDDGSGELTINSSINGLMFSADDLGFGEIMAITMSWE
jgi:hypothetical protein